MVILVELGLNITLVIIGGSINDSVCRDAARAAGGQSNNAQALSAALGQLKIHRTDGILLSQPTLVSNSAPDFVYNDFGGNPPINRSPYVIVTTVVTVKIPAALFFYGGNFVQAGNLQCRRRYTFPIIKEKFYG